VKSKVWALGYIRVRRNTWSLKCGTTPLEDTVKTENLRQNHHWSKKAHFFVCSPTGFVNLMSGEFVNMTLIPLALESLNVTRMESNHQNSWLESRYQRPLLEEFCLETYASDPQKLTGVTTLRIATLALVYSTIEYCAPASCRSAYTRLTDPVINDALRTMTGCLRPKQRPILLSSGAPTSWASSQRSHAVSSTPCHGAWTSAPLSAHLSTGGECTLFVPAAQQLIRSYDDNNGIVAMWTDHRWNSEWLENTTRLRTFIPDIGTHTPRLALPRIVRVRSNRLRTGVGRFRSCLHKWGMAPSAACECCRGVAKQWIRRTRSNDEEEGP